MSARKFRTFAKTDYGIDYSEAEAKERRKVFFTTYDGLPVWHKQSIEYVHAHGFCKSLDGHIRHLPSVYSEDDGVRAGAERQGINTKIQGLGSNLGLMAMYRIYRQGNPNINPVLFIHDDCILEVKEGYEWEAANALCWVMHNHNLERLYGIKLKVPIKGEPDVGKNLGEMYELLDLPDNAPDWVKAIPPVSPLKATKPKWWDDKKDI